MGKEELSTLKELMEDFVWEVSGDDLQTILAALSVIEEHTEG